jgi:hypothetical protein
MLTLSLVSVLAALKPAAIEVLEIASKFGPIGLIVGVGGMLVVGWATGKDEEKPAAVRPAQPRATGGLVRSARATGFDSDEALVDFTVFAPPAVAPDTSFILSVWASESSQHDEMIRRAMSLPGIAEIGSRASVAIPSSSDLVLTLHLDRMTIETPTEMMNWRGSIANVAFIVSVPTEIPNGRYPGTVMIARNGLLIARAVFEIAVNRLGSQDTVSLTTDFQPIRSAFASYASLDRAAVLARVQGIQAAGIDVFLDVLILREGDQWKPELTRRVRHSDVFYLFWSRAASESEWVGREWRLALETRGEDYIHPVPLCDPRDVPPPADLAGKHFNDAILFYLQAEQARAAVSSLARSEPDAG